ncbi:hypothetical protein GC169_10360 [bacterium]|nr:hypothetical protein [bacterium]
MTTLAPRPPLHGALFAAMFALAAPLGGCGFQPLYGSTGMAAAGPIQVDAIDGRTGHFLRQELVRTVGPGLPGVEGAARLEVTLNESIDRLGFAVDQAASRSDYVGVALYRLIASDGSLVASGEVKESASFNFADSAFADIAAQTAARERVASLLARSVREELVLSLSSARAPKAQ